jgi:hypothetical protein
MKQKRSGLFNLGAVLLFALLVLGCKGVPRRYVVGTWAIRGDSREEMPQGLSRGSGVFTFNRNGAFTASQIPGLLYSQNLRPMRLESGSGNWRVINQGSRQFVQLDFHKIDNWKNPLPFFTQLEISSKRLIYFIGNPDDGRIVVFEKQ